MKKALLAVAFTVSATFSFAQGKASTKPSLQLVRNATLILEYGGHKILVDPMLSAKGAIESWGGVERNPTVDLKMPVAEITKDLDLVLVTHTHADHFDEAASKLLPKSIELINQPADKDFFTKEGFTNATALEDNRTWQNLSIHRVEAQHGTGEILKMMGKTSGYVLKAKNQPTIYVVGDAIWTEEIKKNIKTFQPDYIIVNSGGAAVKGYEQSPILMEEVQTMALIKESGKAKVIAVHMDALDHCRTTRASLRKKADELKISRKKLLIPQDGETIAL
ncbi:MBL fold metallo-hydrolase [Rufibacter sediminis]|uniref:MBL fold metallo-hydrolase n=1 Tax=Rufibacter sediminis TaxID=2762756 RepID=A0ABR6VWX1_9BACT|nr:MBL fold metallo-hydrolase [Rufibacter sediminis]MBC3541631.1 MBL fold metallo-hydrolase [Rufibacter sediminis]